MDAANSRPDLTNPNRPGVLSLHIKERSALFAAYMPFVRNGGIFIPTSKEMQLGEEVFLLLTLMDDPQRIAVQAKVVWITPSGANNSRVQGVGVEFVSGDAGKQAKDKIETLLGGVLNSSRPTHTM
ncbi:MULTISPECIES: PilZ domain-containing protein [Chromobacterium]|jgi:type IV pilus assembly protein PilZ|uniref:PilZ domain-containing protein n=2 Tax=Chromobacterium TaxID=535 RepID=A0A1S1X9V9_9NEIS|nr:MULTISPECIES: PilZ domain-containing protein [Chromobacterium]KIA81823.1 pilus assembly protein PilZ [Chromobacterium piscinae]MBM2884989.1 PilZ domain-containing protein [Chromobacterium amazonense]MDE1714651.1 PilZ domain-containing protein [Chromobacterium amazonense]MDQ4540422.1 PilZ domain-containing protein [Chromobacterium amazonense]OHX16585.1 pilus assembly protein PilZ [Chromobacterium amazonense]